MRESIAEMLNMSIARVRLIAPDVGGGFGAKASMFPEDVVIAYASMKLNRPVKWIESRHENLLTSNHGRGRSNSRSSRSVETGES